MKNENKGKENRKDPEDKQRTNKNKNRGQTQSGHTEHREWTIHTESETEDEQTQENKGKKKDPGKEDRRVSEGKTKTERGKHLLANARAPALPLSIPAPSTLPLWTIDQKRNISEQTQTKKKKK